MIRSTTLAVTLLALLTAAPAGAAANTQPSLTVAITDEVAEVRSGDALDYVITVENAGGAEFTGTVSVDPPPFLELRSEGADDLTWDLQLAPGERFEATASGVVGEDTGSEYQVVVLAAVSGASGEVLVRAADSDRIAGTEAPPAVPGLQEPSEPFPWLIVVGAGALVLLVAIALVVALRLRGTRRSASG